MEINNLHIKQCYKHVIEYTTLEPRLELVFTFVLPHKSTNIQKIVMLNTVSAISEFRAPHYAPQKLTSFPIYDNQFCISLSKIVKASSSIPFGHEVFAMIMMHY